MLFYWTVRYLETVSIETAAYANVNLWGSAFCQSFAIIRDISVMTLLVELTTVDICSVSTLNGYCEFIGLSCVGTAMGLERSLEV